MKKILLFSFCIFSLVFILKITGIRFNYTESMPIGFYKQTHETTIHDGDLVAVCLPNKIAEIGLKNHYLAHGSCNNRSTPVLKKVIAIPGDAVLLNNQFMTVDDISYPATRQYKDSHDLPVKKFIHNGSYKHIQIYWLYGANDPAHSWDSRYYGGVTRQHIIGVYKPLLLL